MALSGETPNIGVTGMGCGCAGCHSEKATPPAFEHLLKLQWLVLVGEHMALRCFEGVPFSTWTRQFLRAGFRSK